MKTVLSVIKGAWLLFSGHKTTIGAVLMLASNYVVPELQVNTVIFGMVKLATIVDITGQLLAGVGLFHKAIKGASGSSNPGELKLPEGR